MNIKVLNKSKNPLPDFETTGSAGLDIKAACETVILVKPGERKLIPTGLFLEIPSGYEAQVRPRSGLAFKFGITVLNAPGTIDSDYRGEVGVILFNSSSQDFSVNPGDRIAQLVFAKYERISWLETDQLIDSKRGQGGFGHTGRS